MNESEPLYRLGIDIGGTFTDAMLIAEETGNIWIHKVLSTPEDPSIGFLDAVLSLIQQVNVLPKNISYVVHGTTVATNAIIEDKGAKTGFITTQGFRDLFEMQRQMRPSLYDVKFDKPKPLVPRFLSIEVPERLDSRGNVLVPLDEDAVRIAARQLKSEGVEAIAICFLHGYLNGDHERRAAEIVSEEFPEVILSISSEIAPEIREYFRASTTVINASVRPIVERYLRSIESRLRTEGVQAELLVMQSSGGVLTFASAAKKPVFMIESGPAAGVIASTYLGDNLGHADVISFDMGGTTAKAGLIQDGQPGITKEYEVGARASAGFGTQRGSGYPIKTPVIDLVEIGAGGGSIAWVDSGGVLRVGPTSAGADPGPVCYGRGGEGPTVTDANLVLGRLDPQYFLGGKMTLDIERARHAIERRCARQLNRDTTEVANGIVEIANAAMINALRLVSVQRGYDPRDFALIAFGGAGPAHANRLMMELQIPKLIIPPAPGIFSAMGLLVTELKHDYAMTRIRCTDCLDLAEVNSIFNHQMSEGQEALTREGIPPERTSFRRSVDMRYVGQSFELAISVPNGPIDEQAIRIMMDHFHVEHRRIFGHSVLGEPIEFVNLRVTAIGMITKPAMREIAEFRPDQSDPVLTSFRRVYFAESNGFVECPIVIRYSLGAGAVVEGPTIIEEMDSTTVLHPGYLAAVDTYGNLIVEPVKGR